MADFFALRFSLFSLCRFTPSQSEPIFEKKIFLAQKEVGLFQQERLVMFVSEDAHYSNMRPGIILGIGLNNVVAIKADKS